MLAETQLILQSRYQRLAEQRQQLGYPVYALEHGLNAAEIANLKAAASAECKHRPPHQSHWLVWAALGAEAGYGYSGDEFWPTLEVQHGEWRSNDYRKTLREFYRRFRRSFRGPEPVGRWAEHFSIIAWPINHAILPKYLQAHFARHLFELRHELSHVVHRDGHTIGDLLFKRYCGSSSRFRDFLQQTDLTSQIVLALRDEDLQVAAPRIDPLVLKRIITDLEGRSDAKSYLRDTRKIIHSTAIKLGQQLQPKCDAAASSAGAYQPSLQRFRLIARRSADGRFAIGVQLPDFEAVLSSLGVKAIDIADQRIRFAGSNERPVPASNLVTLSRRERKLEDFPAPNAPLVRVEDSTNDLAHVVAPIAQLEERRFWLLRRQVDGLYREVLQGHVRADQEYLLLSREAASDAVVGQIGMKSATLDVPGATAYRFTAPACLSDDVRHALTGIGIGTATGISIEPAGLSPRPSQDFPTWLSTEPVIVRVAADLDLRTIALVLDGETEVTVNCTGPQTFVELGFLSPGRHHLSVRTVGLTIGSQVEQFYFDVVSPRAWADAMREKAGFRLVLEPPKASFEALAAKQASLRPIGPLGRKVHWSVETHDAAGHVAVAEDIGTTKVGDADRVVQQLLSRLRDVHSNEIDDAHQIDIVASLDELGRQAQRFPRTIEPLRWKFEASNGVVRLIDETDHSSPLKVRSYALTTPLAANEVSSHEALTGLALEAPGMLLTARYKELDASILVSLAVKEKLKNLADLGLAQNLELPDDSGLAAIRLIDAMRRWKNAKPIGYLAPVRQQATIDRLQCELAVLCCGQDFATLLSSGQPNSLKRAQAKVGGSPGFGLRMRTSTGSLKFDSALTAFEGFVNLYGIEPEANFPRYALTLAYRPLSLRLDNIEDKPAFLATLLSNRPLMRGAFLARAAATQNIAVDLAKESA